MSRAAGHCRFIRTWVIIPRCQWPNASFDIAHRCSQASPSRFGCPRPVAHLHGASSQRLVTNRFWPSRRGRLHCGGTEEGTLRASSFPWAASCLGPPRFAQVCAGRSVNGEARQRGPESPGSAHARRFPYEPVVAAGCGHTSRPNRGWSPVFALVSSLAGRFQTVVRLRRSLAAATTPAGLIDQNVRLPRIGQRDGCRTSTRFEAWGGGGKIFGGAPRFYCSPSCGAHNAVLIPFVTAPCMSARDSQAWQPPIGRWSSGGYALDALRAQWTGPSRCAAFLARCDATLCSRLVFNAAIAGFARD